MASSTIRWNEKRVVGIVEVAREHYPDPSDQSGRFGMVDLRAIEPVETPVTLAEIKAHPELQDMKLVRQSRLSVSPVSAEEWRIICGMAGVEP